MTRHFLTHEWVLQAKKMVVLTGVNIDSEEWQCWVCGKTAWFKRVVNVCAQWSGEAGTTQ